MELRGQRRFYYRVYFDELSCLSATRGLAGRDDWQGAWCRLWQWQEEEGEKLTMIGRLKKDDIVEHSKTQE